MDMVSSTKKQLGHSLKYLAAKAAKEEKRKRRQQEKTEERMSLDDDAQQRTSKRARHEEEEEAVIDPSRMHNLVQKTLTLLANDISAGTDGFYKSLYKDNQKLAAEIQTADRKQHERNIQAYTLAKSIVDETNSQTIDDSAPRVSDLQRGGVYLEDVN